ncbi:MAG: MBL fold metallo-hydrolase [Desulfobacula sp.]|nr:MBL fold metallo-hydrolase [Desulfobacula sp.]
MKFWKTKTGVCIYRILIGRCNCYLISDGNRFLLVDSGTKRDWNRLNKVIGTLGATHASLVALVLTHCHFDHAENAAKLKQTHGTPIWVHRSEGACLRNGENPVIQGSIPVTKFLIQVLSRTRRLGHLNYAPADYDRLVDERLDLNPFGFPGYILHTPGHTPGSLSVIIENDIALVGDTLFGILRGSVFPPFAGDPKLMVQSWKKLLDTGCTTFLPAHGSERNKAVLKRQYDKYKKL